MYAKHDFFRLNEMCKIALAVIGSGAETLHKWNAMEKAKKNVLLFWNIFTKMEWGGNENSRNE